MLLKREQYSKPKLYGVEETAGIVLQTEQSKSKSTMKRPSACNLIPKAQKADIEHCDTTDARLRQAWGDDGIYRIIMTKAVPKEGSFCVRIYKD